MFVSIHGTLQFENFSKEKRDSPGVLEEILDIMNWQESKKDLEKNRET